ncbi:hypothetical protein GGI25_005017 [Coemansia spiralis]|uniref:UspA domain-containing protein n=2 Tax=Coemansia TaxID=4863 RepID=A0A9W8KWU8_9FUNG|nr:hypothetical protein BX070DRAFT_48141 [Coemansia spiralis]KAJ1989221.1 hypothetical protein EDC05_004808 [Coemansia umbellata]KAJ2620186.1 hypothetical protein GGI26_005201 [Coemansia sp. RSA 1358]KAJ2672646.1 hypothetical protein GGI25_005017 [Coemansia spiralis]
MSTGNSSKHIPLSLRRKLVIALDGDVLVSANSSESSEDVNRETKNRFATFKTVAWVKANIIRPSEDHVFLMTCIDPSSGAIDTATVTAMWNSLFGAENHASRVKQAEAALSRLSDALSKVGVSVSTEVVLGPPSEKVSEYVHAHHGEILVVQAPVRSVLMSTISYSWADQCAYAAECPTVIVKQSDLPDHIAVALDPPH